MEQARHTYNHAGVMASSLEAKLQQLAARLSPEDEGHLRAMQGQALRDDLPAGVQVKWDEFAGQLTRDEVAELRFWLKADGSDPTADTQGHMIDPRADNDPLNSGLGGRRVGVVQAGAAGLGSGPFVTQTGYNLALLIRPLGRYLPF